MEKKDHESDKIIHREITQIISKGTQVDYIESETSDKNLICILQIDSFFGFIILDITTRKF